MKTITIRDLRHRWPDAEALLKDEGELVVTRDAEPVAKLVRFTESLPARKQFDPETHARWQARQNDDKPGRLVDKHLKADRDG